MALLLSLSCENEHFDFKEITINTSGIPAGTIANGTSSYEIVANVHPQAKEAFRIITFKCSDGEFVGEGEKKSRQVRVESNGEAKIRWVVPSEEGDYFISASIGKDDQLFEAEEKITLVNQPKLDASIALEVSDKNVFSDLKADGESVVKWNIMVSNTDKKSVSVYTSEGILTDGVLQEGESVVVAVDKEGKGNVYLRMGTRIAKYVLKATLSADTTISENQNFVPHRANPDEIFVEPVNSSLNINSSTALSIYLKRGIGKVSEETPVQIQAYQVDNAGIVKRVGRFTGISNAYSDASGKVVVTYYTDTGDINPSLPIMVQVTAQNDKSEVVSNETKLNIIPEE